MSTWQPAKMGRPAPSLDFSETRGKKSWAQHASCYSTINIALNIIFFEEKNFICNLHRKLFFFLVEIFTVVGLRNG